MNYKYKRNGAGDVFRKHGNKVECFYRGKWLKSIHNIWNLQVLKDIPKEEAQILCGNLDE